MSLQVTVSILDREYVVGCTESERAGLIAAAAYLDGKMREIRNAARTASVDRIAVLAALNIAHELLSQQQVSQKEASSMLDDLGTLRARIDATLAGIAAR
jgi:cell division protein ZapA